MNIDLIKKLIELDKKACKLMDDARIETEQSAKTLDIDKDNLYKNYMQRADKRIGKVQAMAVEQEDAKRKICHERFHQISGEMAKNYENSKERWVQELFDKCIE